MIRSSILLLELIILYNEGLDSISIDIDKLKKSFDVLIDLIAENLNIELTHDFNATFQDFIASYPELFSIEENFLSLDADIEDICQTIISSYSSLSNEETKIKELVHNMNVYDALNITEPCYEASVFFKANQRIVLAYLKIGEEESKGITNIDSITELKNAIEEFNNLLTGLDSRILTKIKINLTICNNYYTPDENSEIWQTILFSYNQKFLLGILYDRLEYMIDISYENINQETPPKMESLNYFLLYFLLLLNNYLENNPNGFEKNGLIIKKYLLLLTPELKLAEDYFLASNTLKDFPMPEIVNQNINDFESFKKLAIRCTTDINYTNSDLKNVLNRLKSVTSILFIKAYLDLTICDNSRADIIDLIINSPYYHQPNHEYITKIIDDIIFTDNQILQR